MTVKVVDANDAVFTFTVEYINRGAGRDVWGDQHVAVKLQQEEWHESSNVKEATNMEYLEGKLPYSSGRVLWLGKAKYIARNGRQRTLSCLIVQRQGEDIRGYIQRMKEFSELTPVTRLHLILNALFMYTHLFVEAWMRNCFLQDYALQQVCVRPGLDLVRLLAPSDLVVVDAEHISVPATCVKGRMPKIWKPVWRKVEELLEGLGVRMDAWMSQGLQEVVSRNDLDYNPQNIMRDLGQFFRRLLVQQWQACYGQPPTDLEKGWWFSWIPALPATSPTAPSVADVNERDLVRMPAREIQRRRCHLHDVDRAARPDCLKCGLCRRIALLYERPTLMTYYKVHPVGYVCPSWLLRVRCRCDSVLLVPAQNVGVADVDTLLAQALLEL